MTTKGTYPLSSVTHRYTVTVDGDRNTFDVMTSRNPWFSKCLVTSNRV